MFILTLDDWDGPRVRETVTEEPTWDQLESAVKTLDADRHTLVAVDGDDDVQMLIGGGKGHYIVSVAISPDDLLTLTSPTNKHAEPVELKVGGQYGNYPLEKVADLDKTIQAVR